MSAVAPSQNQASERTFLGHPIGLYVLFFAEMWERFSYYGMRALLILYMVNYFRMAPKDASTIYKVYTSFVYVTPILGGFLADRYLGNRMAVIIGAILMAFGHFMMAFEDRTIFYIALGLLIFGNGFFKPNMSVQVGRLYSTNDNRRDGAYTIFYMGINLGAFLAPLVCGWLQANTVGGYHSGFSMAGVGMVLGLIIYLIGQPFLREIKPDDVVAKPNPEKEVNQHALADDFPISEAKAAETPSIFGSASILFPLLLALMGVALTIGGPIVWKLGYLGWSDAVMLPIAGISAFLISLIGFDVKGGLRDRVISIVILGVFVIFFWGAFEQAGNVQNLWADQSTNRFLTEPMKEPALFSPVVEKTAEAGPMEDKPKLSAMDQLLSFFRNFLGQFELKKNDEPAQSWLKWFESNLNPMPTTWFQAVNAAAIVFFAPIFAWLWLSLDRRGIKLSIPIKMVLGILMVSASTFVMMQAANQQNIASSIVWKNKLPEGIATNGQNQVGFLDESGKFAPFQAGQLLLDSKEGKLTMKGILANTEAFRMIATASPEQFKHQIQTLKVGSTLIGSTREKTKEQMEALKAKLHEQLTKTNPEKDKLINGDLERLNRLVINYKPIDGVDKVVSVGLGIAELPEGFDMTYSELSKSAVEYLPANKILVARKAMAEKEVTGLEVAGSVPEFRKTVEGLFKESSNWRVSPWWLVWSYVLATFGELCISPVGLSMVSKLAPTKYATMLMGIWFLTNSFGNFLAGLMGEIYGSIPPSDFFLYISSFLLAAALILLAVVHWVVRAMHGVR